MGVASSAIEGHRADRDRCISRRRRFPRLIRLGKNSQARLGPLLQRARCLSSPASSGATPTACSPPGPAAVPIIPPPFSVAALDADEIIIWTDVEGVLTADPGW